MADDNILVAPFAGWWTCPDCGREWPVDLEDKAKSICVCDEDTLSNYARGRMRVSDARRNGKCWSCGRWVRLRKDGTLGQHRTQGGRLSLCEGTGKTPGESGLG